jgi:hypothetical protein
MDLAGARQHQPETVTSAAEERSSSCDDDDINGGGGERQLEAAWIHTDVMVGEFFASVMHI